MAVRAQQYRKTKNKTKRQVSSKFSGRKLLRQLMPLFTIIALIAGWQYVFSLEIYPQFIIPSPLQVWDAFLSSLADGSLLRHSWVTLSEMLLGLAFGLTIGAVLGYAIAHIKILEDL